MLPILVAHEILRFKERALPWRLSSTKSVEAPRFKWIYGGTRAIRSVQNKIPKI